MIYLNSGYRPDVKSLEMLGLPAFSISVCMKKYLKMSDTCLSDLVIISFSHSRKETL